MIRSGHRQSGAANYIVNAGDIVYKAVSCTVPSTLTVNMGSVPVGQFSGPGSTSDEKILSIPVRCDDKVAVNTSISSQGYLSPTLGVVA
jgi:type 1 fimbria pilin